MERLSPLEAVGIRVAQGKLELPRYVGYGKRAKWVVIEDPFTAQRRYHDMLAKYGVFPGVKGELQETSCLQPRT